jgi:hypothetical protein
MIRDRQKVERMLERHLLSAIAAKCLFPREPVGNLDRLSHPEWLRVETFVGVEADIIPVDGLAFIEGMNDVCLGHRHADLRIILEHIVGGDRVAANHSIRPAHAASDPKPRDGDGEHQQNREPEQESRIFFSTISFPWK